MTEGIPSPILLSFAAVTADYLGLDLGALPALLDRALPPPIEAPLLGLALAPLFIELDLLLAFELKVLFLGAALLGAAEVLTTRALLVVERAEFTEELVFPVFLTEVEPTLEELTLSKPPTVRPLCVEVVVTPDLLAAGADAVVAALALLKLFV